MISFPQIFFLYLAVMIIGPASVAIHLHNPVHSVLLVLVMFFHMAALYLTLNAEFLAAVQMIVYAGAILVLYLFVVFLVNLKTEVKSARFINRYSNGLLISMIVLLALLFSLRSFRLGPVGKWDVAAIREASIVQVIGTELFTTYLLPFEIVGIILLVAVVGGMVLARREQNSRPAGRQLVEPATDSKEIDS